MFGRDIRHALTAIFSATLFALLLTLPMAAEVTQDFHRTVPLGANGHVSLDNINGNVEITGWDRNEVQIDAVKTARDQQRLDEARIEVNAGSSSVAIKTHYPEGQTNNNPASVHYVLHVPKGARIDKINLVNGSLDVQQVSGAIDAELVNGKIRASNLAGETKLSTVNGALDVTYASLNNVHGITLKSVNGSINLTLPPSANADVEASATIGSISTDFPLQVSGRFMSKSMSGKLGSGGVHIELSNVNGSIHLGAGQGSL